MSRLFAGPQKWLVFWLILYLASLIVYTIFSFSLTAPNLILSNWEPYWQFQTWMWRTFFNHRPLLTQTYVAVMAGLFVPYFGLITQLRKVSIKHTPIWIIVLLLIGPILFASTALSYDVFNYIFNAKMVWVYQANPHVQVALDFVRDDWTRFMHNTHTPAPYGYGWTALSLLPFALGGLRFTLTWWLFRLFSVLSLFWLTWVLNRAKTINRWWLIAVLINPLVLIEIIGNGHNDLWMMVPAVWSLLIVSNWTAQWSLKSLAQLIGSLTLLAVSISIKLATILLVPIWVILIAVTLFQKRQQVSKLLAHWPLLASIASFVPLFTLRSQQFHPWYLLWPLVWIPLIKWKAWNWGLLVLSISSLLRYVPYLWYGEHTTMSLSQQKMITWIPWIVFWIGLGLRQIYLRASK